MNDVYRLTFAKKREILRGNKPTVLLTATHGGIYSFTADEHDLMVLFDGNRTFDDILTDFYKRKNVTLARDKLESFSAGLLREGLLAREGDADLLEEESGSDEDDINEALREVIGAGRPAAPVMRATHDREELPAANEPLRHEQPAYAQTVEELRKDREDSRWKILIPLWLQPLLPVGYLLSLPARNNFLLAILLCATAGMVFGVLTQWDIFVRDVAGLLGRTNIIQEMLVSVLVVQLSHEISRASIFKSETGVNPPFGIAIVGYVLPRFYADTVDIEFIRDSQKRIRLRGSELTTSMFLFVITSVGWMSTRSYSTLLPHIFAWTTVVSAIVFLYQLNPLVNGPGYDILSAKLRMGDLRERAFTSMVHLREQPRGWGNHEEQPFPWGVRLYGILIAAFILLMCYFAFVIVGPYLEARWGGVGVLMLLAAVGVGLVKPMWIALRRVKKIEKAVDEFSPAKSRYSKKKSPFTPTRVWLAVLGGLTLIGLIPYPYEAGGEFVILPAERVDVGALIPGEVRKILVKEGDVVEPGQVLAQLSDDQARASVSTGEAKLKELNARMRLLIEGAPKEEREAARQRVITAQTKVNHSSEVASRYAKLVKEGQVSISLFEAATADAAVDLEKLQEAILSQATLEAPPRPDEILVLQSEIESQETELAYHRGQLEYTSLRSPIKGRVVSVTLEFSVGDYLRKGDLLVVVEEAGSVTAAINVPEVDIAQVRMGERVRLKPWAYPDQIFYGVVTRIAPAAERKEYGKVVRVITTLDNADGLLKSEMTGHAKIRGETMPTAMAFTRMLQRFVVVEIWSWLP